MGQFRISGDFNKIFDLYKKGISDLKQKNYKGELQPNERHRIDLGEEELIEPFQNIRSQLIIYSNNCYDLSTLMHSKDSIPLYLPYDNLETLHNNSLQRRTRKINIPNLISNSNPIKGDLDGNYFEITLAHSDILLYAQNCSKPETFKKFSDILYSYTEIIEAVINGIYQMNNMTVDTTMYWKKEKPSENLEDKTENWMTGTLLPGQVFANPEKPPKNPENKTGNWITETLSPGKIFAKLKRKSPKDTPN